MDKEDEIKQLKEKLAVLATKIEKAVADAAVRKKLGSTADEAPQNKESDHG